MALKSLNTLIKLHKRRIDVLRREMLTLEEDRAQLLSVASTLKAEHEREMQLATGDAGMASFFGTYSKRMRERLANLAGEVKRLSDAIDAKADAIREEFGEQKRYEIAREQVKKRLDEKARASVQQRFDEIGSQQYWRAKEHNA